MNIIKSMIQFPFALIFWMSFVLFASAHEVTSEYDRAKSLAKVLGLILGSIIRCVASWLITLFVIFLAIHYIGTL